VLAGYGKTITHVIIGLKTAKGTKQLKLDPSIYESLQKEKVEPGDVIYIEANSGAVKVMILIHFTRNSKNNNSDNKWSSNLTKRPHRSCTWMVVTILYNGLPLTPQNYSFPLGDPDC